MNGMSEYEFYKAQKDELLKQQMDAKDKRIAALEAQLAEANEKLDKYAGMCLPCPDMGMTLVVERLEQELAATNDKARLQRAINRIEKAGYIADIRRNGKGCLVELYMPDEWDAIDSFYGATRAEAAEAAAQWAESQKEGEA